MVLILERPMMVASSDLLFIPFLVVLLRCQLPVYVYAQELG
jgi:hypothetical protein